jgi:hypothetical protein
MEALHTGAAGMVPVHKGGLHGRFNSTVASRFLVLVGFRIEVKASVVRHRPTAPFTHTYTHTYIHTHT